MKPSRTAMFSYLLGLIVVLIGLPFAAMTNKMEIGALSIGVCALLWVMGTQTDLYGDKKDATERS